MAAGLAGLDMKRVFTRLVGLAVLALTFVGDANSAPTVQKPNILFIAIDDLNDWVGCLGGHPQSRTPVSYTHLTLPTKRIV